MTMLDYFEWTWTLVNLAGVFFLLAVLYDNIQDQAAANLPDQLNGRRGIYAMMMFRHTVVYLLIQSLFFVLGIGSIVAPNPSVEQVRLAYAVGAIAMSLVLDGSALLDLRSRHLIRNYKR